MAAPVASARSAQTGIKLVDGYRSQITIALNPAINFWEKSNKPPGVDGGEPIPQTTMSNNLWRTMAARSLQTLTTSTSKAAYDPVLYTEILAVLNKPTTITQSFGDGSTLAYYGYIQKMEFAELVEGTQPECDVTIVPTNFDPVNHVEAGPTLTSVAGT